MLQLLLGTAGTGKTHWIFQRIAQLAQQGKHSILLVPEQFSAGIEARLYQLLGDELSLFVTSCSFRTLAEQILNQYGGGELPLMSEAGRAVLVRRAMDALEPEVLGKYSSQKRSAAFCMACADVIQEMKTAGVSPELMQSAGQAQPRLKQLGAIYGAYQSLLENIALDPVDCLSIATQRLCPDFFEQKTIFFDNFDGFTAPQYKMLQAMLQSGADVVIGLCCPGIAGGQELFSPAQETARRLRRLASSCDCEMKLQILSTNHRHQQAKGLELLTEGLSEGFPLEQTPPHVWVTPCTDSWQQAKYATTILAQQARKGIPYSRMAVICREKDPYAMAMRWEAHLLQIPLFEDMPALLQFSPIASALLSILKIAKNGINTQDVLTLLKTGLVANATTEQIALLERYTQVWKLWEKDWKQPLLSNRTLEGFEGDEQDQQQQAEVQQAEQARRAVAEPLQAFCHAVADATKPKGINGAEFCKQVYQLLEAIQAPSQAKQQVQQASQESQSAAEELQRMWDKGMELLQELYSLLQQDSVTATEVLELVQILLRSTELGRIPQYLEGVLFTTPDRFQPDNIDYCIVLGANEGEFPRTVGSSGLLTHADRDLLKQQGANLPGDFEQRVTQEQLYFYRTATAAQKGVWFLYQAGQAQLQLSQPLQEIAPPQGFASLDLAPQQFCLTPSSTLDWVCGKGGQSFASQLPPLQQQIDQLAQQATTPVYQVEDSLAMQQLLGNNLTISPSRMERFYLCKLAYFLEYVVGLKMPRPAKLDFLLTGSLVHYILEKALQHPDFLQQPNNQQALEQLAKALAEEYIAQLPQTQQQKPLTKRERNILSRVVQELVPLLEFLQQEQQQSQFQPIAFEMPLGAGGAEGIQVPLPNQHTACLRGKIDRVDAMEQEQQRWLRVIDYKTGNKKFSLDNVYYGLDTQMLLYLFSLCTPQGQSFPSRSLPAGVVYVLVSSGNKTTTDREKANQATAPKIELHGLIADQPEVYLGMDTQATGKYLPFGFKKDGSPNQYSKKKLISHQQMLRICSHLKGKLQQMGSQLYAGQIEADPLKTPDLEPCKYCKYQDICRREADALMREMQGGEGDCFLDSQDDPQQEGGE